MCAIIILGEREIKLRWRRNKEGKVYRENESLTSVVPKRMTTSSLYTFSEICLMQLYMLILLIKN